MVLKNTGCTCCCRGFERTEHFRSCKKNQCGDAQGELWKSEELWNWNDHKWSASALEITSRDLTSLDNMIGDRQHFGLCNLFTFLLNLKLHLLDFVEHLRRLSKWDLVWQLSDQQSTRHQKGSQCITRLQPNQLMPHWSLSAIEPILPQNLWHKVGQHLSHRSSVFLRIFWSLRFLEFHGHVLRMLFN